MAPKIQQRPIFDENVCCCGSMDSVTGCRAIAAVELLATVIAVVLLIVFYFVFHSDTYAYQLLVSSGALAVGLCCCVGAFVVIGALLVGLRAENPTMLLFHIVGQVFAFIGMGFAIISAIIILIGWSTAKFGPDVYLKPSLEGRVQDQYAAQQTGSTVAGIVLALSIVGFFLNTWFFIVVFSVFRMFKNRSVF